MTIDLPARFFLAFIVLVIASCGQRDRTGLALVAAAFLALVAALGRLPW